MNCSKIHLELFHYIMSYFYSYYRLSQFALECKGSDRQDVKMMKTVMSKSVAAGFKTFAPDILKLNQERCPDMNLETEESNLARLSELAEIVEMAATCYDIFESRVIEDKSDMFKCSFR